MATYKDIFPCSMKVKSVLPIKSYEKPNFDSSAKKTYYDGNEVNVELITDINNEWWAKLVDDKTFIKYDYLVLNGDLFMTVKNKTIIRKQPNPSGTKQGRYPKGLVITVIKMIPNWCLTNKGWVLTEDLEPYDLTLNND